jgi:hypothetical protein
MKTTFFILILITLIGCEKIDIIHIKGTWINEIDYRDTLFIGDSEIIRIEKNSRQPIHIYKYSLSKDNLTLKYDGLMSINVPEMSFKIEVKNERLIIVNLSSYFPRYQGDTFRK